MEQQSRSAISRSSIESAPSHDQKAALTRIGGPQTWRWLALFFLLLAAVLAGRMGWGAWTGSEVAGCGGKGCATVAASAGAWVAGLPVGFLGAAVYAVFAATVLLRQVRLSLVLGGLIAGAALWFVGLQGFSLGAWCMICLVTHGLALGGGALALLNAPPSGTACGVSPQRFPYGSPSMGWTLVLAGLISGVAVPAALPSGQPDRTVRQSALGEGQTGVTLVKDEVQIFGGAVTFARTAYPYYGDPQATDLAVGLWDPACGHCREMHGLLPDSGEKLKSEKTGLLMLPVSVSGLSRPWAHALMAVWLADPASHRKLTAALSEAAAMTAMDEGTDEAREAWLGHVLGSGIPVKKWLVEHAKEAEDRLNTAQTVLELAWQRVKEPAVPVFVTGTTVTVGAPQDQGALLAMLRGGGDPCDAANRAQCGGLVVPVLAAGTKPNDNPYPPADPKHKTFDPLAWDALEYDTYYSTKQFAPHPDAELPVQIVALTSDEALDLNLDKLLNATTQQYRGAAKITATKGKPSPALQEKLSAAIDFFSNDTHCQQLMRELGLSSVLPLIKVEYLVNSEFAYVNEDYPGIPAWSSETMSGSLSEWFDDGQNIVGAREWAGMTEPLRGAVEHLFVNSCSAVELAKALEQDLDARRCSCFVAATSADQKEVGGGGLMPFFNYAMTDHGDANRSLNNPNSWGGADNVLQTLPSLYEKHRDAIFYDGPAGLDPRDIIDYRFEKNPLLGLVYTSVDVLAEDSLNKLKEIDQMAADILDAQYMAEMPPIVEVKSPSPDLSLVLEKIGALERMFQPYLKEQEGIRKISITEHTKCINAFADCAGGKIESVSSDNFCKKFVEFKSAVYKKDEYTDNELSFMEAYSKFVPEFKEVGTRTLLSRYGAKEVPLSEAYTGLQKIWSSFSDLKQAMSALSLNDSDGARQVNEDVEKSFDYMIENFEKAYSAIRNQMYDELRREAIRVKIARLKHAVQTTEQYYSSLPAGMPAATADGFLRRMSSKFNCLSRYAVGPGYDKIVP